MVVVSPFVRMSCVLILAALPLPHAVAESQRPVAEEDASASFVEETVRTYGDGRVYKRKVDQKADKTGFSRLETWTDAKGRTATVLRERRFDAERALWRVSESGQDFEGRRWSRQQEGEPVDLRLGERGVRAPDAKDANVATDAASASAPLPAAIPNKPVGPKRREFR